MVEDKAVELLVLLLAVVDRVAEDKAVELLVLLLAVVDRVAEDKAVELLAVDRAVELLAVDRAVELVLLLVADRVELAVDKVAVDKVAENVFPLNVNMELVAILGLGVQMYVKEGWCAGITLLAVANLVILVIGV